jgi:uncharacterized cupredoxin-like copper-binding protein
MHSAALHLAPILAAEKSKVPFYVAGGVLVAWALIVSLGLGLRRSDFPGSPSGERAVMVVTAVLVLTAVSMAVVTSGPAAKAGAAAGSTQQAPASVGLPAAPAASTPTSTPTTTQPKATTGTPAPASPAPAATTTALALAANPTGLLSYDAKQLSAKAGSVAITLTNAAPLEHNVTVAQGTTVLGATPTFAGGHRTLTLKLKPGTYTFYCSVPGHRQAGMEGTLSVS